MSERRQPSHLFSGETLQGYQKELQNFRFHLFRLFLLKYTLSFSALWGFVWGIFVLVMRIIFDTPPTLLFWGLSGFFVVFVWAIYLSIKKLPDDGLLYALLDKSSGAGGLLMASLEADITSWDGFISSPHLPKIHWDSSHAILVLIASLFFMMICFFAPHHYLKPNVSDPLDVTEQTDRLANEVRVLKKAKLITDKQAKEIQKQLNNIKKEALGREPSKTWKALDHLSHKNKELAKKAAEHSMREMEKAINAQKLARKILKKLQKKSLKKAKTLSSKKFRNNASHQKNCTQKISKKLAREMAKLAKMMKKMKSFRKLSNKMLSKKMRASLKLRKLTKKTLKKLEKLLAQAKKKMAKKLAMLAKSGLLGKGSSPPKAQSFQTNGNPSINGKGHGISRGGASAPMTWQKMSKMTGVRFKSKSLPLSMLKNLKKSRLIGLSMGKPQKNKHVKRVQFGALYRAKKGNSSARKHVIYPRYIGSIKRYFEH